MGGMSFEPMALSDRLSETAGYKAGVTLSIDEICDHLSDTKYPNIIRQSEENLVRLRSEEYETLFYKLLYRIGYTEEEYDGDYTGAKFFHKYKKHGLLDEYMGMLDIFSKTWKQMLEETKASNSKAIDPTPFVLKCLQRYGAIGAKMALEHIEIIHLATTLSPHSIGRAVEWETPLSLSKLFKGTTENPEYGKFIDQRYINYLSKNPNKLGEIHWRKLEELTAEFFEREGYKVALGYGGNDDGVDIRIWNPNSIPTEQPLCLIQCKRQKAKVEKVIVKGLHADVLYEGAKYGIVVTTSELSPGSKKTINTRGYPIQEVNRNSLTKWLTKLRVPGTGIVRI